MFRLDMTPEEASTLVRLLTNKAKEIHTWRIATKDHRRDGVYNVVVEMLKKLSDIGEAL